MVVNSDVKSPMSGPTQAAGSFSDTVKLLVTLGSGVLVLSGTFASELSGGVKGWVLFILFASWIALTISVLSGVLALYSLAESQHSARPNWWELASPKLRLCYKMFLIGIVLLVVFAMASFGGRAWALVAGEGASATCDQASRD